MEGSLDRLEIANSLFTTLDAESVVYNHWKSNEHLSAAVRGQTDLDLLVRSDDREKFLSIIEKLGFVAMVPAEIRRVPGVESFLGFDEATGTLLHLDVHYRLVLGEQLIKNHHLPIEAWLLADSGELEGVRIPAPSREFLLLYVRAMLKTTNRQFLRSIVKGGSPLPERIMVEARWLAAQVDDAKLDEAVATSGLDLSTGEVVDFHRRVGSEDIEWRYVRDRKLSLRKRLRKHERLPRYRAVPKRLWLRFRSTSTAGKLGLGIPKRRLAGAAPLIAAVGADGSGKSRLTKDLERWLAWKLDVVHVYFGQPKGGLWWRLLSKPGSLARKRGENPGIIGTVAARTDSWKWLWLANHRRHLSEGAHDDANHGIMVIAERYPLPEFQSMSEPMDGPRLQGSSSGVARRELDAYGAIDRPDLLIILDSDLKTLRDRKLDLGVEEHTAKVEAVNALTAGPGRTVIDAGPPYERVLLEAKTAVWQVIRATR
jgi:thymidylate kinase